jgi:hypothetical protein
LATICEEDLSLANELERVMPVLHHLTWPELCDAPVRGGHYAPRDSVPMSKDAVLRRINKLMFNRYLLEQALIDLKRPKRVGAELSKKQLRTAVSLSPS